MGTDASIPETHKAPMLLACINSNFSFEPTAAELRTKTVTELTWDYVATTLIDEFNAKQVSASLPGTVPRTRNRRRNNIKGGSRSGTGVSNGANNGPKDDGNSEELSDLETTTPALAAALKIREGRSV